MKRFALIIFTGIAIGLFSSPLAMADSPLTSTYFGEAYIGQKGFPSIKKGDNLALFKCLSDQSVPVDYRLAAINLDGWDINGKHRAERFKTFLELQNGVNGMGEILTYCPPEILICYAYLKAMDDYFHVDESIAIAGKAFMDKPKSNTIFLIYTLLWAQKLLNNKEDWGTVYVWTNLARLAKDQMEDHMLPEAEKDIFDYIDEYKDYVSPEVLNEINNLYICNI